MSKTKTWTAHNLSQSPALPLVYEGMHDLVGRNLMHWDLLYMPVQLNQPVVLATDDTSGEVLGIIAYHRQATDNFLVGIAYVEPASRRLGIFKQMHYTLVEQARMVGVEGIQYPAHPRNEVWLTAIRSLKAKQERLTFVERV